MSMNELEQKIRVATLALEKASKTGNNKIKKDIVKEMKALQLVLEQSKQRLKEIDAAQKTGSKVPTRTQNNQLEQMAEEMTSKEPADPNAIKKVDEASSYSCISGTMPWLAPAKTTPEKEESKEDRNDKEEGGGLLGFSFGKLPSVSSLGSQLFWKSETKRVLKKEVKPSKNQKENQGSIHDALRRNEHATRMQEDALRRNKVASRLGAVSRLKRLAEEEIRDQPIECSPSEIRDQPTELPPSRTGRDQPVKMKHSSSDCSWGTSNTLLANDTLSFSHSRTGGTLPALSFSRSRTDGDQPQATLSFSRSRTDGNQPLEINPTRTRSNSPETASTKMLSADEIAEQELKARETYITAQKWHQDLRRKGLPEESPLVMASAKKLRDCYADIEYWEYLAEDTANRGSKKSGGHQGKFRGRDPFAKETVDVDKETTKARDAYVQAMKCHQELVPKQVSTSSKEWIDSQNRVNDALSNLQYWEGRSQFSVPPTIC